MSSILLRVARTRTGFNPLHRLSYVTYRLNSTKTKDAKDVNEKKKTKSNLNNPMYYTSPITWRSLTIGGSIIMTLTGYFYYLKNKRAERVEMEKQRSIGAASIECSFDLVDTNGKPRTSQEFLGKWLLVYFGFTHCPDVCPEELEKLATAVEKLHADKVDVVPIFITVDPWRDKPELIAKYLSEFSDKFIGLTGDDKQIQHVTRSFRVYYSPGPKDSDNDYIVDHTIISYLIGPKGELVDYFGQTRTAEEVENSIRLHKKTYKA